MSMTEETQLHVVQEDETSVVEEAGTPQLSLLRVWHEVLSNIEAAQSARIDMYVAGSVVNKWPNITFQEVPEYHKIYHDLLLDVRNVLDEAIKEHPEAMDVPGEEDMEKNHKIYHQLVIDWNILFDQAAEQWDVTKKNSHIRYAAITEARAFLFREDGLAGHLEERGFEIDHEELAKAVLDAREENK